MYFPVSGVEIFPLWPFGCAFMLSLVCSMAGVSGAFLLLPYQISVLGYAQPGVSATNQIFNVIACPAGVWRYYRENRLLLPLAGFIAIGTLPGVFLGAVIRLTWLANLRYFLIFVAVALIYIAFLLLRKKRPAAKKNITGAKCVVTSCSIKGFAFTFSGADYTIPSAPIVALSLAVGLIGGIYGIGGGAIISPALAAFFNLPVYAIAGASLFATFLTSIAGVAFYSLLAFFWAYPWAAPDWALGCLFGLGGLIGMYCGARLQKFAAPAILRSILIAILLFLGLAYLIKGLGL